MLGVARTDFPKSLNKFQAKFSDEASRWRYLIACRWPEIPVSTLQRVSRIPAQRRYLWQCKACGYQTSVTAGTVLHRRTPLREGFWAADRVTTHTPGLSALPAAPIGPAALRDGLNDAAEPPPCMVRPARESLRDQVEVDETSVGNQEGLRRGRELGDRALVSGGVEVLGRASGRIRLRGVLPDASAHVLCGFITSNVDPGTLVLSYGWQGYAPLFGLGYHIGR